MWTKIDPEYNNETKDFNDDALDANEKEKEEIEASQLDGSFWERKAKQLAEEWLKTWCLEKICDMCETIEKEQEEIKTYRLEESFFQWKRPSKYPYQ